MQLFSTTNLVIIGLLVLASMAGERQQAEAIKLELLLLIPTLLLKLGLAAPIVLAVFAKLLLLLGLGKAVLLTSLLGVKDDSGETLNFPFFHKHSSSSYTAPSSSSEHLGRIKRSVDFVQEIVGKEEMSEEKLLETIFRMDTKKCGEKLLCQVASSVEAQSAAKKVVDLDEAAILSLFGRSKKSSGPAQKAYKDAIVTGLKKSDCAAHYPTCPFEKSMIMQLVHFITDSVSQSPQFSKVSKSLPVRRTIPETSPLFLLQQQQKKLHKLHQIYSNEQTVPNSERFV